MTVSETARWLCEHDHFILSTHESPDADGLGAEFALAAALQALGKDVLVVNAEQYAKAYAFMDTRNIIQSLDTVHLTDEILSRAVIILLDTNDIMYTGSIADTVIPKAAALLVIDHHEVSEKPKHAICSMPKASSTCEIVHGIISALGCKIDTDSAVALLAGIVYDTGSFAYSKTSMSTFKAALDLIKHGADSYFVYSALYESSDISVLLLRKKVLSTLELYHSNTIAMQTMNAEVLRSTGSAYEDAEGLINVPLQARSVEVSVFFKEKEAGMLRCSLRSKGKVNVAGIAQNFGGGGHKRAAGFKCLDPLDVIKKKVLNIVAAAIDT